MSYCKLYISQRYKGYQIPVDARYLITVSVFGETGGDSLSSYITTQFHSHAKDQ